MNAIEKKIADEMEHSNQVDVSEKYHITVVYYNDAYKSLNITDWLTQCHLDILIDSAYAVRGDYLWQLTLLWAKHHGAKYVYDKRTKLIFTVK